MKRNHFNFALWNWDGRPASKAPGSDAFENRVHWKFNGPDVYVMISSVKDIVYTRGNGYFKVDPKYYVDKP